MSAPIAPRSNETFEKLKKLHPTGDEILPIQDDHLMSDAPHFSNEIVKAALCSFNSSSAGGLFGYKPLLLQQCVQIDTNYFLPTLSRFVNVLASGAAPGFLKPFVAGGNSIALVKGEKFNGVRPLCSGDPIRRLTAKCFCLWWKG